MPSRLHDIQYHAIIFDGGSGGAGPGSAKVELDADMLNLVWHQGLNGAGQAAFTMVRGNKKLAQINYMRDHIKIYRETSRGTTIVFSGKVVRPNKKLEDTIVTCWDYVALLQRSRTAYKKLYPNVSIGSGVVSPEWLLAKNAANSPLGFVSTGTIENPVDSGGTNEIKTNEIFGVNDFDRLWLMYSLAEMSMVNTTNTVVFEITRNTPHTFNFWKNRSTVRSNYALWFPGNLMDYSNDVAYDRIQNDIATVITDPTTGLKSEYVVTDSSSISTYGRLQSAATIRTLYGLTATSSVLDQQKAALLRILTQSVKVEKVASFFPRQGAFEPFDGWDLGDKFPAVIKSDDGAGYEFNGNLQVVGMAAAWTPSAGELLQVFTR
jgi:hypothetical protein